MLEAVAVRKPRIVVVGCGGLGSFFGAQCARAGFEVTLVARGQHGDAIRARGLEVLWGTDRFLVPVDCVASTAETGPADLVLLCVKCYDIEGAARSLTPLLGSETVILTIQNGVDNLEQVPDVIGRERLLGAAVFEGGAHRIAPGVVRKAGSTHLVLGGRDVRCVEKARWVSDVLRQADISSSASESPEAFLAAQWRKLCRIAALSGVSCVTRASAGEIIGAARPRALLIAAVEEALRVASAIGVALDGGPVVQETLDVCERFPQMRTSMLVDLEHGRPIEVDALSGAILRAAARAGIDAPIHRFISAALALVERGAAPSSGGRGPEGGSR